MATSIYQCLTRITAAITENKDFLTELDREIGDADHGLNMARGFAAVLEKVPQEEPDFGVVLKKVGMTLLSTVGGASGPLYGTAYMEAAKVAAGKTEITADLFDEMLGAAIAGIERRGKAVRGEKTMLDALIPAKDAFAEKVAKGASFVEALDAACAAAEEGVAFTKTIAATKGRAAYLGERSIGHQDPGATSATLMLESIRDYVKG
ncbi:MAG: dihydroxyacetone kinase subunit L [Lachnospiraceae bacterium]|nr:dihydroxyacetone kinase subunit L [Lachnospiraceae bacterium]